MYSTHISHDGQILTLGNENGPSVRFHATWLRDNAPDAETRSPANGQKLITLANIPEDTGLHTATLSGQKVDIVFSPDGKPASFDITWLQDHHYDRPATAAAGWLAPSVAMWDRDDHLPSSEFGDVVKNPSVLHHWLTALTSHGIACLTNGPAHDGALFQVVDLFGHVRETNYGRHFDVRTTVDPENLAYTGLGLQAHTDNPYRDPVPTVQVLYCLESSAKGGENMVVDGFAAAKRLQAKNPAGFRLLSRYCARFEYAGDSDTILKSRRPMIELAPDGELIAIRFNNRSCAPITDVPFDDMAAYYLAYRQLAEIIDDPAMQITFRLTPGDCFVVDNTRVLHARRAYSGTGTRWLQGCYADLDGVRSRLAVLDRASPVAAE